MAGSDYHHGDMDVSEQVATFHLVMGITKWGSVVLAALLLTLVIWFCTGAGFLAAAITGFIVLALGIVLLRERKGGGH